MANPEASTLTHQNSPSESMANLVNSSATTPTTAAATSGSLTAAQILAIAIVAVGGVGMVANALVAYVVLTSKHFKKTKGVNLLIANQLLHDMFTCMTLIAIISTLLLPTATIYRLMRKCVYVYLEAAFWAGLNGSVLNLACVTVERYLMVVHMLWHRKWFSSWMVFTAGAASWIVSWISALAASLATASVDASGFCLPNTLWPSRPARLVYAAWNFVSYFVIEAVIFIYCYIHIMLIIRRQTRIKPAVTAAAAAAAGGSKVQRTVNNPNDGSPAASRATAFTRTSMFTVVPATVVVVGSSSGSGSSPAAAAAAAAATANSSSATSTTKPFLTQMHLSALKTSIIVTTVFFISWSPYQMYTLLSSINNSAVYQTGLTLTLLIVLLNVCVNPFIYAGKYDLIKHRFTQYCTKSKATCQQCAGDKAH